ncbi:DNA primase [Candidatus Woesearchaeota archaeon]|nr:DNA primase [Candidatus Woesearchaeota archaeon]
MGKISPVSAKYIIHTNIQIEGVVERPDVIGAIFGQTEGLLGAELELRELQRSGRIGRIEVNVDTKGGKAEGMIIIPSSLDKAETAIVGAALETIQRIGPCNAKVRVEKIEDVRISKRGYVIERAKELLKNLTENVLPDSQEITEEVAASVRMMEIIEYGRDRLPAGPAVEESEEIILVEGRADVLNLLKHGIKNVIGMNGTNIPPSIKEIGEKKVMTLFVDGDRGGDLIIKEISEITDVDYIARAPDGKEVEEITKKEIHKALRGRVAIEQEKLDSTKPERAERTENRERSEERRSYQNNQNGYQRRTDRFPAERTNERQERPNFFDRKKPVQKKQIMTAEESVKFKLMLEDLVGTRGAYIIDQNLNILGKVPVTELASTIKSLNTGVYAVLMDGKISAELVKYAEKSNITHIIGMETEVKAGTSKVNILIQSEIQ